MKSRLVLFSVIVLASSCYKNEDVYKIEKVQIQQMILSAYPATNNGETWDIETPSYGVQITPDVYAIVSGPNYHYIYSKHIDSVETPVEFYLNNAELTKIDSTYTFNFYDEDGYMGNPDAPSQWMATLKWTPSETRTQEDEEWVHITSDQASLDLLVVYSKVEY